MSRAFVKEQDADFVADLPDRPLSEHPNHVTERGLRLLEEAVASARVDLAEAQVSGDRHLLARVTRDLRYWSARLASAHLVPTPLDLGHVAFGVSVTIVRDDGREQKFRIVGEDEADPSQGTIAHVSPLARAMLGKMVGDEVQAGNQTVEITFIESRAHEVSAEH